MGLVVVVVEFGLCAEHVQEDPFGCTQFVSTRVVTELPVFVQHKHVSVVGKLLVRTTNLARHVFSVQVDLQQVDRKEPHAAELCYTVGST